LAPNRLKEVREDLLISKSELARKAGVSQLTVARVEKGIACRQETKRKILAALGLKPWEKEEIFP
jgi:predicted transcriptional regulator